jgi:hypothetical protein
MYCPIFALIHPFPESGPEKRFQRSAMRAIFPHIENPLYRYLVKMKKLEKFEKIAQNSKKCHFLRGKKIL